jgi:hypothetical protein
MRMLKPLPLPTSRPFPPFKTRRLTRQCVTIVAGFKCKNGVVICADTQHTGASVKFTAPKLWTDQDRGIVAGACNDVTYLRMAVDEVSDRFEKLSRWTQPGVKKAILDALIKVHQAIRAAFDVSDPNRPLLSMLIGARLDNWKVILLKTSETAVAPVDNLDFIGSGEEVARLLMSPFYDPDLRVTEMQTVGAYCFRFAKASGSWCGGETHIGVIFDGDPETKYAHPAYIRTDRGYMNCHILSELAPALASAWNVNISREEFEKRVSKLTDWLRSARERQEKVSKQDIFISSASKPSK